MHILQQKQIFVRRIKCNAILDHDVFSSLFSHSAEGRLLWTLSQGCFTKCDNFKKFIV